VDGVFPAAAQRHGGRAYLDRLTVPSDSIVWRPSAPTTDRSVSSAA
jgi:hypothetical protein